MNPAVPLAKRRTVCRFHQWARWRRSAVAVTMLATLCASLATPVAARPPRGQLPDNPTGGSTPTPPPADDQGTADDDVPIHKRGYMVEALAIKVLEESGPDWPGSNEVYGNFITWYGPTAVRLRPIYTEYFGNLDNGDRREFASDQRCLNPRSFNREVDENEAEVAGRKVKLHIPEGFRDERWECIYTLAPLKVEFALWESDVDHPEPWDVLCGIPCEFDTSGIDLLPKLGDNDDLIGRDTVTFSPEGLANDLPRVGSSETYTRTLTKSGRFEVTFKVTRHH